MSAASWSTRTVPGDLSILGNNWNDASKADREHGLREQRRRGEDLGWSENTTTCAALEIQFAGWWVKAGSIIYELTEEIAAMFALTTAPPLKFEHAPHEAFLIKVPRAFLPASGSASETWICAAHSGALVIADFDTTAEFFILYNDHVHSSALEGTYVHCNRILSNFIAYISTHRECVRAKGKYTRAGRGSFVVSPPRDIVVTHDFRKAAADAVSSGSILGIRRALAHVVRGHWRNQASGKNHRERKLIWIRPHRRGDESLGSVVSRIERVTGIEPN